MLRFLKSFDELSLELVATDTIADRTVLLQLPASRPQATSPRRGESSGAAHGAGD